MTSEFIIIIILFVYIGFLHYQLHRKNTLIELLIKKNYSKADIDFDKESLEELIRKLNKVGIGGYTYQNKLFEEEVYNFLISDLASQNIFIHYTKEEEVAKRIVQEGFRFVDTFYKTAEPIVNDKLDLIYKHYLHRYFGKFVVIIGISKEIHSKYIKAIANSRKILNVEQVISQRIQNMDDKNEEIFLLPNQYIKGYINTETGEIISNISFNPNYEPPFAAENIR